MYGFFAEIDTEDKDRLTITGTLLKESFRIVITKSAMRFISKNLFQGKLEAEEEFSGREKLVKDHIKKAA